MQERCDPAALRQWLTQYEREIVGYTRDMYSCPLALWLAEMCGEPCFVWAESYRLGDDPWQRLPAWASAFVAQVEQRFPLAGCAAVSGQEALAVLDALAAVFPECARKMEEPDCLTLREALDGPSGAVTSDGKSHVRYHEDYHIELDCPWVYYPDLSTPELWILRDDELVSRVPRSQERCWLSASNFIW